MGGSAKFVAEQEERAKREKGKEKEQDDESSAQETVEDDQGEEQEEEDDGLPPMRENADAGIDDEEEARAKLREKLTGCIPNINAPSEFASHNQRSVSMEEKLAYKEKVLSLERASRQPTSRAYHIVAGRLSAAARLATAALTKINDAYFKGTVINPAAQGSEAEEEQIKKNHAAVDVPLKDIDRKKAVELMITLGEIDGYISAAMKKAELLDDTDDARQAVDILYMLPRLKKAFGVVFSDIVVPEKLIADSKFRSISSAEYSLLIDADFRALQAYLATLAGHAGTLQ